MLVCDYLERASIIYPPRRSVLVLQARVLRVAHPQIFDRPLQEGGAPTFMRYPAEDSGQSQRAKATQSTRVGVREPRIQRGGHLAKDESGNEPIRATVRRKAQPRGGKPSRRAYGSDWTEPVRALIESIDMDSCRVEKKAVQQIILADEEAEIAPIPVEPQKRVMQR